MKYEDYSVEDFILDEYFRRWVLYPDQANRMFWLTWIKDHPHKVRVVEEARDIIRSAEYDEIDVDEERTNASWEKLKSKVGDPSLPYSEESAFLGFTKSTLYRIAAVFAGLL